MSGLRHRDVATGAATALDKALSTKPAMAAATSIFGTEMVAMLPVSLEYQSAAADNFGPRRALTESDNPYMFRFLPNDREIKVAHARYVVEKLKKTKPRWSATRPPTARAASSCCRSTSTKLGVKPVLADSVAPDVKDMSPLSCARSGIPAPT